jgi:hypothetical protein
MCWSVPFAELVGPRIEATLVMPGADWIRLGPDGCRRQDQRLAFQTADGAVVLLSYDNALIRRSEAFLDAVQRGRSTAMDEQYMRMVAQFDTGDSRYAWLTQSLFIGEGRLAGDHQIEYVIYRVE